MRQGKAMEVSRFPGIMAIFGALLLMAMALAMALAPTVAFADEHVHDGIAFQAWGSGNSLPGEGSYYLTQDVTLSAPLVVQDGKELKLCLDGHTVTMLQGVPVCPMVVVSPSGVFELYDAGSDRGMFDGGGAYGGVEVLGTFTMRRGRIANTATAVSVYKQDESCPALFTMTGGVITELAGGAGVVIGDELLGESSGGTFVMSGGSIIGNEAAGGLIVREGTLRVSGAIEILANQRLGKALNVFLSEGTAITVHDTLSNAQAIGVTTEVKPREGAPVTITSGYAEKMGSGDPSVYFESDDPSYIVTWNDDKTEAVLAAVGSERPNYSVHINAVEHGAVTADKMVAVAGDRIALTATPNDGYELAELVVSSMAGAVEVKDGAFIMPADDVIVTASFGVTNRTPESGDGSGGSDAETGGLDDAGSDGGKAGGESASGESGGGESGGADSGDNGEPASSDPNGRGAGDAPGQTADASSAVSMRRLYNPYSYEHFYTADDNERVNLVLLGWVDEGEGWIAPGTSDIPVYRLYNPYNGGDHHYTKDPGERDALIAAGWTDEGTGWYSADENGTPVYREYNPFELVRNHNYTRDEGEHDGLVALGWADEGVAWYGV